MVTRWLHIHHHRRWLRAWCSWNRSHIAYLFSSFALDFNPEACPFPSAGSAPRLTAATSARLVARHAPRDMQVPYELKQSPIAGLGLFATAPIARGTLLWKYDGNSVKEYEEAALRLRLAPLSAAEAVELCEHVFCWEGKVCEIVDDGKYWNHAKGSNQNTGNHPDGDAHGDGMSSYALRDIAAGEELTDDYALYDKLPWFEAICQEREVTGSCTEVGRQFD